MTLRYAIFDQAHLGPQLGVTRGGIVATDALKRRITLKRPLNESSGSTAFDISGNGLHGNILNSPVTYNGEILRAGHSGAMGFRIGSLGIAQVHVPHSTQISNIFAPGNEGTIICWHKPIINTIMNTLLSYYSTPTSGYANYRIIWGGSAQSIDNNNDVLFNR